MDWQELTECSDDQLSRIDPVVLNLEVARGIPASAHLHVYKYQRQVSRWADDFRSRLPGWEAEFHKTPEDWDNDLDMFRLGHLCY